MEPANIEPPAGAEPGAAAGGRGKGRTVLALAVACALVLAAAWALRLRKPDAGRALIPAGEFQMGSPEGGEDVNELPRHKVYLDAFKMDRTEVTNAEFKKFADAAHYVTDAEKKGGVMFFDGKRLKQEPASTWKDPLGDGKGISNKLDHPAVQVSWNDAAAYCKWAGGRLPTEAEWEKAARGGTDTRYSFGDDERRLNKYAWYSENSGSREHPVGLKSPNRYGLYDMHGNVWEWVADWYNDKYYAGSPAKNPQGPAAGLLRGLRGGGYGNVRNGLRSAYRARSSQGSWSITFGFRCAFPAAAGE